MEVFKIQFDYTTILTLITLSAFFMVVIMIKVIYRHDPHVHEQYGDEIVLFHSEERYKKKSLEIQFNRKHEGSKKKGKNRW